MCSSDLGPVNQELLARNEYLAAENRILKAQLKGRLKLSEAEFADTLRKTGNSIAAIAKEAASKP